MSQMELILRTAIHTKTQESAEQAILDITAIYSNYHVVTVKPKPNQNSRVPLEWYAMVFVYERGEE